MSKEIFQAIKDRIEYFKGRHHSFEAKELQSALDTIERLVPPSQFALVQGQEGAGMQWVKASKRLPENKPTAAQNLICFRSNGMLFTGWHYESDQLFIDVKDGKFPYEEVEWLDESAPQPNDIEGSKIFHGLAPCHRVNKSYRDIAYSLRSALQFANNLPHGASLTAQLIDVIDLLWEYEDQRLKSASLPSQKQGAVKLHQQVEEMKDWAKFFDENADCAAVGESSYLMSKDKFLSLLNKPEGE